jgi:transporter family-2 protein
MYYIFSIIAGAIVSIMVVVNGKLSDSYGVYLATAAIHLVGLLFAAVVTAAKKETLLPAKKIPFHLYLGGVVGVLTVVFNNMCFGRISISAILAISLLGQGITSLVFDQYGFFGMPRHAFHKNKLIGLSIVLVGIIIMVSYYEISAIVPIILSLLTGLTVVLSRTINAGLAEKTSIMRSTLYYYVAAFVFSFLLLIVFKAGDAPFALISSPVNPTYFLGGIMGVLIIIILNATVAKISSLYMTLLLFAGQVFTGIAMDMILTHAFSLPNLLGGVFVTLGLCVNVIIDRRDRIKDGEAELEA